ncbi:MAG: SigB/SigF/SigG family RNA polymerase sigma factor [Acidimicrobiia bacterium]
MNRPDLDGGDARARRPTPDPQPGPFAAPDPETLDLFAQFRRTGSRELRNELIERHIPMAESLARRYLRRGESFDDLRQVALVGLLKAVERFEPGRGTPFGAFAIPTVRGELRRHFRDLGWAIKVPRRLQEMHLQLDAVAGRLAHGLGRPPTIAEIAADMDTSEESVLEALEIADMYRLRSLDAPPRTPGLAGTTADRVGAIDPDLERAESRIALDAMLEELPERDRRILLLRYFEDMTQTEIAATIGVSQMHVSRLISRSLAKLRASNADADPLDHETSVDEASLHEPGSDSHADG